MLFFISAGKISCRPIIMVNPFEKYLFKELWTGICSDEVQCVIIPRSSFWGHLCSLVCCSFITTLNRFFEHECVCLKWPQCDCSRGHDLCHILGRNQKWPQCDCSSGHDLCHILGRNQKWPQCNCSSGHDCVIYLEETKKLFWVF